MKKHTLFFCMMIVLLSCSNDTNNTITANTNEPILIVKGILNYNTVFGQENMVIATNTEWQALIASMQSINENVIDDFTETTIDFEAYMVIAVFDIKNSTTSIDITSVTENDNNIVISVDNLNIGITQDVAHPYHIIKIRKSSKPIVFE
ncbi:hypothetical protein DVK85_08555 [Flavobacterium arcticum]|uniref:Protease complex subunit PrcB family protein n=1 Tax=Flavobacterium arcticum TaxID=1784713 RepID=A0A345HCH1_9FLAO|nr:protease complex subunit PrcB family protein [Flavobacterium arcticum]AXG74281.1 hypothetical protein DVK85_08555 [Flavobacterium arcticum]KAF2508129.1 hypothetical protein E0W72_10755 [Flavobacterium arcticum]